MVHISRRWRIVAWCIYLAIAFAMTHTPGGDIDLVPGFLSDTIMHAAGYCILGILSIWVAATNRAGLTVKTIGIVYLAILAYGVIDERTQPLVGRSCELSDWLADAAGGLVGIGLATAVHRRLSPGPSTSEF